MNTTNVPNRVINHVALSVSNIEEVVNWYSEILGFKLIGPIQHIKRTETPEAAIFGIYPGILKEAKLAWLVSGNGVGFEIFEFIDPKFQSQRPFEDTFHQKGFFHVCVTEHDPESLISRIKEAGGRQIGVTVDPLNAGVLCTYAADPWGNVVEILNLSFEHLAVAGACAADKNAP